MTDQKRQAINYITGRYINKVESGSIFNFSQSSYFNISGGIQIL